ncbi:unnamed protein product [Ilex paraguariensis]|uniref:Uncharacterized protein n=1 Tax=Ilex paraguariensis TaxID=185542 RepID=A0ABC8SB95_9AQUA
MGPERIVTNHTVSHACSVSGFQPFVWPKSFQRSEAFGEEKRAMDMSTKFSSSSKPSNSEDKKVTLPVDLGPADYQAVEKEEGEWSDVEGYADAYRGCSMHGRSITGADKDPQGKSLVGMMDHSDAAMAAEDVPQNTESVKDENIDHASIGLDSDTNDKKSNNGLNSEGSCKGGQEDSALVSKQKKIKGVEANHALKYSNNHGKRPTFDPHKEAMLGKKRSRQTMFFNFGRCQASCSTPRKQNFPAPIATHTVKELRPILPSCERIREKQIQLTIKDAKQVDLSSNDRNGYLETDDSKSQYNGDINSELPAQPRRLNSSTGLAAAAQPPLLPRQSSWKQPTDSRQLKNSQVSSRKPALMSQNSVDLKWGVKRFPSKKQPVVSTQFQDTSVECLLREVTNEKFWLHPACGLHELSAIGRLSHLDPSGFC